MLGDLFGQFGEDDGARGSCGYLEYYLVVTRCGVLVLTFAARDVSEEVVDFVTEGLGGDNVLALKGGHACKYFEVCDDGVCGIGTE